MKGKDVEVLEALRTDPGPLILVTCKGKAPAPHLPSRTQNGGPGTGHSKHPGQTGQEVYGKTFPIQGLEHTGCPFTDTEHLCSDGTLRRQPVGGRRRRDVRTPTGHCFQTFAGGQCQKPRLQRSLNAADAADRLMTSVLIPAFELQMRRAGSPCGRVQRARAIVRAAYRSL
ncbi:hypothetical protein CB1_001033041 [Camelus ferus]|nr:hypothetical protein CB1_001033041 [Camelus ferus]